ncbi:MAG: hypothetical protein ACXAC8_07300 [Candidatus Hodarchaeales archaeon]|jgi:hypothetical protein
MNIADLIQPIFEIFQSFVIIILLLITLRKVYRILFRDIEEPDNSKLKKANTEYHDPPRPNSKTFNEYLHLALMSTPERQKVLARTLAQLISEYFGSEGEFSDNIMDLMADSNQWLLNQFQNLSFNDLPRGKDHIDILHEKYIQIFEEIQQHLGFSLVSRKE